jgi:K+-sensing histidine kinase KdpD
MNVSREQLLAAAAHELRGPLSVIAGMASVLRERAAPRDRDCLEAIVIETGQLTRMLDNLLAVTRLDAVVREFVPLEEMIGAAFDRLAQPLEGHAIRSTLPPDTLAHVDPVLGELLVMNLVERASKSGGPVELAARRDGGRVVIEVTSDEASRRSQNVDLGLAVVTGIVAAHHGTIEHIEPPRRPAVWRVTIPDAAPLPEIEP